MKDRPDRAETIDTILGGALTIVQPRNGYRFSIDSILLARFADIRPRDRVLELGAGCGVISILIAAMRQPRAIVALERQPDLAELISAQCRAQSLRRISRDRRPTCAAARFPGLAAGLIRRRRRQPAIPGFADGPRQPERRAPCRAGEASASAREFHPRGQPLLQRWWARRVRLYRRAHGRIDRAFTAPPSGTQAHPHGPSDGRSPRHNDPDRGAQTWRHRDAGRAAANHLRASGGLFG